MQYRPQINSAVDSEQAINNVYFYPGKMPSGEAVDYYYPPDNFLGHILLDATDTNGYDATNNPYPYALADNYNNAMRYPDELALFNARVGHGDESDDSPTLRILMERLYRNPESFRNAIFVNLHGELFPFPPVRNYSDPAKEPEGFLNVRVVTHPERLHYTNGAADVKLRVYSYRMKPTDAAPATNSDWLGQYVGSPVPIKITLKGVNWTPTSGTTDIQMIKGGTDQDATLGLDAYGVVNGTTASVSNQMYYSSTISGGDTILSLFNSPLRSPEVNVSGTLANGTNTGLNNNSRLYGLEYIPAPSEDLTVSSGLLTPFTANLATTHTSTGSVCTAGECEPNTARWIITIPAAYLPGGTGGNGMLTVETRINSTNSGTRTNQPPNLSTTYVWRGSDTWTFGDGTAANPPNLPITETYQLIGDPRHNPYADLKAPHYGSGLPGADRLGMGYNRYFDDFENSSYPSLSGSGNTFPYWKGYEYTVSGQTYGIKNDGTNGNAGWTAAGSGYVELDMNRIYQIERTLMARPRTVSTSMTGYSFYYCGIGGEIGYDSANSFPNSIPINSKLFTGASSATHEQSILPSGTEGVKYVRENVSSPYWWGIHWLGELYPDSSYIGGVGLGGDGKPPHGLRKRNVRPHATRQHQLEPAAGHDPDQHRTTNGTGGFDRLLLDGDQLVHVPPHPLRRHGRPAIGRNRNREPVQLPALERDPDQPSVRLQRQQHRRQPGPLPPGPVRAGLHGQLSLQFLRPLRREQRGGERDDLVERLQQQRGVHRDQRDLDVGILGGELHRQLVGDDHDPELPHGRAVQPRELVRQPRRADSARRDHVPERDHEPCEPQHPDGRVEPAMAPLGWTGVHDGVPVQLRGILGALLRGAVQRRPRDDLEVHARQRHRDSRDPPLVVRGAHLLGVREPDLHVERPVDELPPGNVSDPGRGLPRQRADALRLPPVRGVHPPILARRRGETESCRRRERANGACRSSRRS